MSSLASPEDSREALEDSHWRHRRASVLLINLTAVVVLSFAKILLGPAQAPEHGECRC